MEKQTLFKLKTVGILLPALAAIFVTLFIFSNNNERQDDELNMPRDYVYGTAVAANGMELHYLRTRPSNVALESIHNNVTAAPYYGINGGFFYQDALLSIAVVNDLSVNEAESQYGTGETNAKYARGTLVWDGNLDRLSVQVVSRASELSVTDRTRFWAQGGISMSLDRNDHWLEQAAFENAPLPDDYCLRSAAVYDLDGSLYLIVSTTKGSLASFREAILEQIGDGKLINGIFLDGDGSSQLRSREAKLIGDGRPVVQMLRLLK
ncbi:phosphodiester glycosidase family protein [Cohnella silvisoli]|uniref:Phosphodiester glycosidase family protein n=1 Tax=Cohnella silvisoli TaxID=2873699 RepID=A0ABV1KRA5_9BACL|nr:phosphodiester glycosidase family protein [Cohnella silvisoli]MCD9021719.1 phosphodiester glycosidase family protein [Cohnella silvisoli]